MSKADVSREDAVPEDENDQIEWGLVYIGDRIRELTTAIQDQQPAVKPAKSLRGKLAAERKLADRLATELRRIFEWDRIGSPPTWRVIAQDALRIHEEARRDG